MKKTTVIIILAFLIIALPVMSTALNNTYSSNKTERIVAKVCLGINYTGVDQFNEGLSIVNTAEGKYGAIDITGKEVIPAEFHWDAVESFSEGLAMVRKDWKFGYIDRTGAVVIPFIYDSADSFNGGLAKVKREGKYGFIDKFGRECIPCIYNDFSGSGEGLIPVKKDEKWGFVDFDNNIVIPFTYDSVSEFAEGLAAVKKDGKYCYISRNNETEITTDYDYAGSFKEGLALVKKNYKYGYIDKTGNEVIPLIFKDVYDFREGVARARKDGQWGYIDKTGNFVLEPKYDLVYDFCEGFGIFRYGGLYVGEFCAEVGDSYGYVDRTGKVIASGFSSRGPVELMNNFNEGLAVVTDEKDKRKYGVINNLGEVVMPIEYDMITDFNEGYAVAEKDDEWFILVDTMNSYDNPIQTFAPTEVDPISGGEITVTIDGAPLVFDVPPINEDGRVLVPMRKIFESLGAVVEWDGEEQKITAVQGDTTITMQICNTVMVKNGQEITLDVPPKLVDDRTLVPIRAVAEGLGAEVEWVEELNQVKITTGK